MGILTVKRVREAAGGEGRRECVCLPVVLFEEEQEEETLESVSPAAGLKPVENLEAFNNVCKALL